MCRCCWRDICRIGRQRSPFDVFRLSRTAHRLPFGLDCSCALPRWISLRRISRTNVVVCQFDTNLPSISPLAIEVMPTICSSTTTDHDILQAHPRLADEIGFLVVIKDRYFELVIIRRVMDGEAKLLIPFGCLAAASVRLSLLCFFPKPRGTVWILFADCFSVRKVLRLIKDDDEISDFRAVDSHIGVDTGCVHGTPSSGCRAHRCDRESTERL